MDLRETPIGATSRHPWELARHGFFTRVLRQSSVLSRPLRILDVGAGDSWFTLQMARVLPDGSRISCWDANYTDGDVAALGEQADETISFVSERPCARFDLVLLLDVLEHIPDDRTFLREIVAENTSPGSTVLISVPAWRGLYSEHDRFLLHERRYNPSEAASLLTEAGLRIHRSGGLFSSLLVARMLVKAAETARARVGSPPPRQHGGEWTGSAPLTGLLYGGLAADGWVGERLSRLHLTVPGLSWWALCTR